MYDEVVPLDLTTPATVVVPRSDRTIRATWMERAAADRLGVVSKVIDGGHCPHVSRPLLVAEIIDAIGEPEGSEGVTPVDSETAAGVAGAVVGAVSNPLRCGLGLEVGDIGSERGGEFGDEGCDRAVSAGAESGESVPAETVTHR